MSQGDEIKDDVSDVSSIDLTSVPQKDRAKALFLFYVLKFVVAMLVVGAAFAGLILAKISSEVFAAIVVGVATLYIIGKKRG